MSSRRLKVKLWGVRGSFPTPYASHLGFGGNTPCVEVRLPGDEILILDAGSGIRQLGQELLREGLNGRKIHLFLTHFHWDHIHGLPFFAPVFEPASLSFYTGGHANTLKSSIRGQMKYPYFPVDFDSVASQCEFQEVGAGPFKIGEASVYPFPVNHPQGAYGFRIESNGASLVYAPDREFGDHALDATLRKFSDRASILIVDSQYTLEEYTRFKGWGHSTWNDSVEVARDSKVEQLILFHHDPDHDDAAVARIETAAKRLLPNACAGREGWIAEL